MSLSRLVMLRRKRDFPYFVSMRLVLGLCQERGVWKRERSQHWWNDIVKRTFDNNLWIDNFRMTRGTFFYLCEKLQTCFPAHEVYVRDHLELNHKVAITIYWLASSAEYRTIGNLFGVGVSTVHKCVHDVCNAIAERLLAKYVKFPKYYELKYVIDGYQQTWGFPNCADAIDGTHILIMAPPLAHGDYVNRKGWFSILLQGVCDHQYIITDLNVGWPGKVHDASVFGSSELYYKGETNDLSPNWTKRCLLKRLDVDVEFVSIVITTCVILHNIREMRHENFMADEIDEDDEEDEGGEEAVLCAKELRDDLAKYFSTV